MKIKSVRAVSVNIPRTPPKTPARRDGWNSHARRALPINKYPEFPTHARPDARRKHPG